MPALSELRLVPLSVAIVLLAACTMQKTSRPDTSSATKPVQSAPVATPVPKPPEKSAHPQHNHAPPAAAPSSGLPAHEVGYYLDVLQGRLRQQLDPAVIVGRKKDSIVLDFSRRLGFATAAQVDDAGRSVLAPLAKVLVEYKAALVSVRVSAEGDEASARKLAQLRASAVERLLIDAGVSPARVVASVAVVARNGGPHVEIVLAPEMRGD